MVNGGTIFLEELVRMDNRHRVVLTRELREAAGIGDEKTWWPSPFWGSGDRLAQGKKFRREPEWRSSYFS